MLIADMSNDRQVAHDKCDIGDQCWWQVVRRNTMRITFLASLPVAIPPDSAPTAPHKLRGFSYGSSQLQKRWR